MRAPTAPTHIPQPVPQQFRINILELLTNKKYLISIVVFYLILKWLKFEKAEQCFSFHVICVIFLQIQQILSTKHLYL